MKYERKLEENHEKSQKKTSQTLQLAAHKTDRAAKIKAKEN